jgi:hypothetical protein
MPIERSSRFEARHQSQDRDGPRPRRAADAARPRRRGDRGKRCDFITLLGGAAVAWPLAARAQQSRRIGILVGAGNDSQSQACQQLGWADGLQIDVRWGGADIDYIRASAGSW